jgi:hypothetical protein
MPNIFSLKGMHSLKTLRSIQKSAIPNKQDSDFIKFYMLEKERNRLRDEKSRILLRLEIIQNRLKEIEAFYKEKQHLLSDIQNNEPEDKDTGFKKVTLDY